MRDVPWLPPSRLTYRSQFAGIRAMRQDLYGRMARMGVDVAAALARWPVTDTEARWKSEDDWLTEQWRLTVQDD